MTSRTLLRLVTLVMAVAAACAPSPAAAPPTSAPSSPGSPSSAPARSPVAAAPVARPSPAPSPAAQPEAAPRVGFPDRVPSPAYGVHVFLWGHPDTTQRDLRLAKEAGFSFVKQRFEWRDIERDGKGKFEWSEPDRIVREVAAAGLAIVARLDNQPKWARKDNLFPGTGPPASLSDWRDFAAQLASRYRGRIAAYEIWNEPNLDREWANSTPSAREYVALLKTSYQAIKKADPDAEVISAGLSPTTSDGPEARPDGVFLEEMYRAGLGEAFDMLGVHAAGYKAEPEADPGVAAASPALTNGDPSPLELKRTYAFRHVEDMRKIMVEHGDAAKRVAIMEMGWTSDPRPDSPYKWYSVSEDKKGENIVRAFMLAHERWQPWIAYMSLIYLSPPEWTDKDEQYWWSISNPNGTPRVSYDLIRAALR